MASRAINAKSFCNYVVSLCTYLNGTALSSANKTQLYNYLIEGLTPEALINIKTALAILNKINIHTSSEISISVSGDKLLQALSYNTSKALTNVAFPESNRAKFCTLNLIYDNTGNLNDYNFMNFIFYLPAKSTESYTLMGTLVGGGGGGGGGLAGDGDKHSNYYGASGTGAAGGKSTISILNTVTSEFEVQAEAAGGTAGGNRTLGKTGGDPGSVERPGNAGGAGATTEINIEIVRGNTIQISPGYGGGGGGGIGISTNNSSSYSASNGSEAKGGNGKEANSFTGDDNVFGGGGGEGGHGTGYTTTGVGSNANSGPNANSTTKYTPSYQSNGIGGKGGWSTLTDDNGNTSNANQPTTIGAGGNGGRAKNWQDTSTHGNGGNGGNSGGFIINSESSAASALFIWKQ